MRAIIFSGYSPHNKEWAGEIAISIEDTSIHKC